MNTRDILSEILSGKLSEEQVAEIVESVLKSDDAPNITSVLGLNKVEWTAYAHGATLYEIAQWRRYGWPTKCYFCGGEIDAPKFGWRVIDDKEGRSVLRHIECPPKVV